MNAQAFDDDAGDAQPTRTDRPQSVRSALIIAAVLVLLFYALHVGWLFISADEGDVPPLSAVPLPAGTVVLNETVGCGSGGCSVVYLVEPPQGQTPSELAAQLGATQQLSISGNLWDPRTVFVRTHPSAGALKLTLDYTSGEWVP